MDSGNSGSIQSSSGGEEEFDSRAESISSLFNSSNQMSRNMMLNPPPSSSHHPSLHHPPFFDSFSNFLNTPPPPPPPPPNTNSFLNLDMTWTRSLPSQPNCTDIGGLIRPPSSTIAGLQGHNPPNPFMGPSIPLPSRPENEILPLPSPTSDQPNATRSSKKRCRASRRAPTTVLTTDTSNFRAMVQEFTGIPAPPFSAAAPFAQSRLNLFGTALSLRSGLPNAPPPPYLLRPFPHKVTPQPSFTSLIPLSSSSSSSSCSFLDVVSSSTAGNSIGTSTNAACNGSTVALNLASAGNYQLPSDLGLPKLLQQQQTQLENPMFTIQSLLQSSSKYPLAQGPIADGGEFPMNHGHLDANQGRGTHTNLISSDGMSSRTNDHPSWGDGSSGEDQGHLRPPFDWNCSNSQKVSGCKTNYTASTSDFHVEKGSENVSSKGEGIVESWIFTSD